MNFPKSTIKKSLHIIPDSLKDGVTGDAQVTIGYQIYNLAKLTPKLPIIPTNINNNKKEDNK